MSLGLLFPGQGTQNPEMLPWLDNIPASAALRQLREAIGVDWRLGLEDPAWSIQNCFAQPLLTATSLAAWQQLRPLLPPPAVVAGYSVGELAAFSAVGVFDAGAAIELARRRAAIMDDCVRGLDTGLLSIGGAAPGFIEALCERLGLDLAIRLGTGQAIVGGEGPVLQSAQTACDSAGVHAKRLAVGLASHTRWLAAGVPRLAAELAARDFARPDAILICNDGASTPRTAAALRRALAAQMAQTVPWDRCMDEMAQRRPRCVLEVGAGSTLSTLWNARHPQIPARSADEFRSAQAVADWVGRQV